MDTTNELTPIWSKSLKADELFEKESQFSLEGGIPTLGYSIFRNLDYFKNSADPLKVSMDIRRKTIKISIKDGQVDKQFTDAGHLFQFLTANNAPERLAHFLCHFYYQGHLIGQSKTLIDCSHDIEEGFSLIGGADYYLTICDNHIEIKEIFSALGYTKKVGEIHGVPDIEPVFSNVGPFLQSSSTFNLSLDEKKISC